MATVEREQEREREKDEKEKIEKGRKKALL